jgi:hypothetical protein
MAKVSVLAFSCPTCGARIGKPCTGPGQKPHGRRLAKLPKTKASGALQYACPTCKARIGERCRGSGGESVKPHPARREKFRAGGKKSGSVRAIPSAIETDRRKH